MEEKEKKKDEKNMDGKKTKINNWIENILVFVVIPLVLFLLFLSPSVNMKSNKGNLLLGSWKKGTEKLDFYADGTYSLNNKKGKVERKSKKEINLTAHGLFTLKEKENRLEFTDKSGKVFKWDRDNLSYPGVWVAKSQSVLAFTKKDYLYYNRNDNPNGKYTVKNAVVTLDKVGAPGKWSGADLSWGGNNVYTKVLDKPILKLDKKIILGSWQTSNNRVLTFYDDGTYTFPDNSKPRKAFQLTTCGVLLDGIPGVFVLTSDSTGAWCGSSGGKPLDYVKK